MLQDLFILLLTWIPAAMLIVTIFTLIVRMALGLAKISIELSDLPTSSRTPRPEVKIKVKNTGNWRGDIVDFRIDLNCLPYEIVFPLSDRRLEPDGEMTKSVPLPKMHAGSHTIKVTVVIKCLPRFKRKYPQVVPITVV